MMLGWRYCCGFSAHSRVHVAGEIGEGRMKLVGYMIRAPITFLADER